MPNANEVEIVARRVLPVIYVLDTSGSMADERIAAVNAAMNETVDVLKDISKHNPDAEIKIGVLKFAAKAEWVTKNGLVFMEDFFWNDLTVGGTTEVAQALQALDEKLSRKAFLVSDTGFCLPVIIFMSDGAPTDPGIWESKLEKVRNTNKWFKYATKIALAVGEKADKECLARIVGEREAVAEVTDLETLKALIKVVSVTSSLINSKSRTTADAVSGASVLDTAQEQMDNPDGLNIYSGDSSMPPLPGQDTKDSDQGGSDWESEGW